MAKDDYFVLAAKILAYLYMRLRGKEKKDISYLSPKTKDFPIEEDYFEYVLLQLEKQGYIEKLYVQKYWGGQIVKVTEDLQITPDGIEYLQENSMMKKVFSTVKDLAELAGNFL